METPIAAEPEPLPEPVAAPADPLESALQRELGGNQPQPAASLPEQAAAEPAAPALSKHGDVEDEMQRLLSELSSERQ